MVLCEGNPPVIGWFHSQRASNASVSSSWHTVISRPLHLRNNERDGVSIHQPHDCLLNCLLRLRWKKASKLRVTGLCVGNSPVTGEFPAQMASNAENASIWWRHHVCCISLLVPHHRGAYLQTWQLLTVLLADGPICRRHLRQSAKWGSCTQFGVSNYCGANKKQNCVNMYVYICTHIYYDSKSTEN